MYSDAGGQRLTLSPSPENAVQQETDVGFAQDGKINVFFWIDGPFGDVLLARIDKYELARVAGAVYDQVERT